MEENSCDEKESLHNQCITINPLLNPFRRIIRATDMQIGYFFTSDKFPLFYRLWGALSGEIPKKIVVCIHGLHSHGEKFIILADHFVALNWCTYAIDLRGHGLSWNDSKNKGDIPEYNVWISDVTEFLIHLSQRFPNIPVYLVAESMGVAVSVHVAQSHPENLKGLVFISPALKPWTELQFAMIFQTFTYALLKFSDESVIPHKEERKFATNNDNYIKYLLNDPLKITNVSPRYYYQVIKMIHTLKNYNFQDFYPTCVFFGEKDHLIDFNGVKRFVQLLETNPKALHYIPEGYHDLLTDDEAMKYDMDKKITEWIDRI
jgi:alpha-beta hydrolase superfamily lysophospholipase